ncbi:MAG: glutamine--fructose-6-phosphate transaminase (isomerizing) [Gammaproteobacteria bacterium]|nr:glutamine--fructose-6-phosphate transaminase (isomerizing) [Gammaproteobacteria bacterium]
MCGIVGAVAQRNVSAILLEGLRRLEYRGYDSAGIAVLHDGQLERFRSIGKVKDLAALVSPSQNGHIGIAHTRWATHGVPSKANAHPHFSNERIAVVHNGIIENHLILKEKLQANGYVFTSETDTEVIAHLVDSYYDGDLFEAVKKATNELEGAYALGIISKDNPSLLISCRRGSPLVLGVGFEENFIASDASALLPVTSRFVYLEEGDFAVLNGKEYSLFDQHGESKELDVNTSELTADSTSKGNYRHFMLKEIYEQTTSVTNCLEGRISKTDVLDAIFGAQSDTIFDTVENIQIIACGTSYHAGCVAKYWVEELLNIPCQIEVASEYRYRKHVICNNTLFVTLSQSGETADTIAALRNLDHNKLCGTLSICNVPESSLVRESDLVLMTRAGPEIGVASTKAFTTQLVALMLLVLSIGKRKGISSEISKKIIKELTELPKNIELLLGLDKEIEKLSEDFIDKQDVLFLGRGEHYPIAMEGALKLKEISYIHAEAYPAGELKHGPIALVDAEMPIIVVTPNDELLEKLQSNMQEVQARGGQLYVFAHKGTNIPSDSAAKVINMNVDAKWTNPILSTIPLQFLSYHVAVMRGTDVDQPRNLAKSVTVE